jgi:flagellar M-ring protein FliF
MNQLTAIWNSMSMAQRISLVVVPLLLLAAGFGLVRWRHESDFRTLYTSLAPEDAASVTQKVREAGIEYRLDETGTTVMVPSASVAEARLALAGAGLPHTGRIGFELFDKANLGASDFTEQVNYRRALEGELERTVATLTEIDQARIHITFAKESVFLDSRLPAKATVVLKLKRAGILQQPSVMAIANLVASSVDGLAPEAVAVIDSSGRLLNRPRPGDGGGDGSAAWATDANLDYRRQIEAELNAKINTALEPLVGAGHFHAGVNVDCDFTSSEQSDEIYDSSKSAMLQSQTTEESNSLASSGGTPGTAANLPHPPARDAGGAQGLVRRTENLSFQPGRTVRKTLSPKGTIRRVSTAVLIDQTVRWEGSGTKARRVLVPASAELLKGIHDVVAGITGFSDQRGDQITIESLPFETTLTSEPPGAVQPATRATPFDTKQPLVIYGSAVILLLVLAVAFLAIRRPQKVRVTVEDDGAIALPGSDPGDPALPATRESVEKGLEQQIADNQAEQAQLEAEALSHIKMPANTRKTEVLVRHIRDAVQKDPVTAANVLRTWVTDKDTRRK